jgi:hypothetical protein
MSAPGERRVIGRRKVEAHDCRQRVHESFGLAQRQMEDEPQCQDGIDSKIGVSSRPAPSSTPVRRPGGDHLRRQPDRHVTTPCERPLVGRPIPDVILGFVLRMGLDFIQLECGPVGRPTPRDAG